MLLRENMSNPVGTDEPPKVAESGSAQSGHRAGLAVKPDLSVVMPCLNEADTLETCIGKALR